jgi:structural maintenance of chromosome 2
VVVESKKEATEILKHSNLQQRVTFMPIQETMGKELPREIVAQIEKLTNGKARLAIDLLEYDKKFARIMQSIFGSTFICEDNETAKRISN